MGLERNSFHYYCGHLLAYCTSPASSMVTIVQQLLERMSGRGNHSTRRKPAQVPLCLLHPTWLDPGSNPGHRSGKPATLASHDSLTCKASLTSSPSVPSNKKQSVLTLCFLATGFAFASILLVGPDITNEHSESSCVGTVLKYRKRSSSCVLGLGLNTGERTILG
jgi:hypothetical protein